MNFTEKKIDESNKKKKDPSIELLRIIGCINVIATHVKLDLKNKKNILQKFSIIFNGCLCADGVGIFWYIMGFFLFNKISYKKRLNLLFQRIGIPLIITTFFYFYFQKYNFKKIEFISYIKKKSKNDYLNLLYKFLTFDDKGHLWFCYVYILIVFLYPSFEGLNNFIENNNINSFNIFFFLIIIFIENDFLYNKVLYINHHGFNGLIGAIPFIFCGNELKKNIYKFKNKKIYSLFLFLYIGNNYLRCYLIKLTGKLFFIKWYTSFGIINVFFLFMFAYSFYDFLNNKIIYCIITKISSMTFYIYLIHIFVMNDIFKAYRFNKKFHKKYYSIKDIFYYQFYSIFFVFIVSLIISVGIMIIKKFFNIIKDKLSKEILKNVKKFDKKNNNIKIRKRK